ncbi:MAG: carbohydrate binding family 9 domain-containing protein [Gemmatimonadetes bacterium]|nr:carbohydrate binding family 9 domain-containing protein [Gemmatimonadota bacterium]
MNNRKSLTPLLLPALVVALTVLSPVSTVGQTDSSEFSYDARDNPVAPVAPATMTRTDQGRVTVRAVRLTEPLNVDGVLDEAVYQTPPITGFLQTVPLEGEPASERTDAWVFYDDQNLYLVCRCWDSAPPEEWIANEMRRDTNALRQNDVFGALFDTFHDRRNGFNFYTNPLGARADQWITDEGNPNTDWNPVWSVRTGRFDGGWTAEMAIPFKSLRYLSGEGQTWGIQMRRVIRRRNEFAYLAFVPASAGGSTGIFRVSAAADLVGLDLPSAGKNIEIKPYVTSSLTSDLTLAQPKENELDGEFGGDLKYGITANITADLTYNTDFAQVEVDERQVNLSRFSLFFPEKREFFLEGRGTFDFGRASFGGGGGFGGGGAAPTVFFSRRIGLSGGEPIPILGGGRVTGKAGRFGFGAMSLQTDDVGATPSTNFTVVRVKQDILRRSSIGALFTNRSKSLVADGANQVYGVDGNFNFGEAVSFGGFYALSRTPGLNSDNESYVGRAGYGGDKYGLSGDYTVVGDNFNPEIGLVRRDDFRRYSGSARFSPRPQSIESIRQFRWQVDYERIESLNTDVLETEVWSGRFNIELENSDQFSVSGNINFEALDRPLRVSSAVSVPVGDYDFKDVTFQYSLGAQRRVSGSLSLQIGEFYDGTIRALRYSRGRISVTDQFSLEPSVSYNDVELSAGDFTTTVMGLRADFAFTPLMFVGGLVQYDSDSDSFSTNLRFRWEYAPGSEFFVVYTDERATVGGGLPTLENRAFVLKINRLLRF